MQWNTFDGKCGICGDPYDANPGDHEVGGKYVNVVRPLSRCYDTDDSVIDITVRITSHHKGYFEFWLCENNNMAVDPSIDCFNNLLTIAGTNGNTRYSINDVVEPSYSLQLNMPADVTCSQCILRWKYNAGNSYGCDETGCGIGLGPQEQFINCADIAILEDCSDPTATSGPIVTDTTTISASTDTSIFSTGSTTFFPSSTDVPLRTTDVVATDPPSTVNPNIKCRAVGMFEDDDGMDRWCMANCLHFPPYCPPSYCMCVEGDEWDETD
ncbi:hypothetical protein ACF0H5_019270 [Mactra antiquata]